MMTPPLFVMSGQKTLRLRDSWHRKQTEDRLIRQGSKQSIDAPPLLNDWPFPLGNFLTAIVDCGSGRGKRKVCTDWPPPSHSMAADATDRFGGAVLHLLFTSSSLESLPRPFPPFFACRARFPSPTSEVILSVRLFLPDDPPTKSLPLNRLMVS